MQNEANFFFSKTLINRKDPFSNYKILIIWFKEEIFIETINLNS